MYLCLYVYAYANTYKYVHINIQISLLICMCVYMYIHRDFLNKYQILINPLHAYIAMIHRVQFQSHSGAYSTAYRIDLSRKHKSKNNRQVEAKGHGVISVHIKFPQSSESQTFLSSIVTAIPMD